jgi:hypothetical protein
MTPWPTGIERAIRARVPAVALLVALLPAADAAAGAASAPPWLREAAAVTLTPAQASAPAVVLLDERMVTVSPDGSTSTRHIYAAKIGTREGRDAARLAEVYLTDGGRVRQARGWIIRPSGEVQEIDKDTVLDLALAQNDVYNEARLRLVGEGSPEPGTVFGAEIVSEERSVFTQLEWRLQGTWPVKTVRRGLTVPPGWKVTSTTFNHAPVEPATTGSSWTWELRDLPIVEDEPASPPLTSLVPRVAVTYIPPQPSPSLPGFSDWKEVSRWLALISDGQAAADPALTAKAQELTAHAGSEFEKVRAIGAYVQHVTYISIQIGLGRGGGYRPRPATQVFSRNLGDCKDKSNLMRAMLAVVGIRSYLVSAFSGDRDYVREAWPSPQQFNHCILAVVLSEKPPAGTAVVDSPGLGPLLFVDPTAEYTPVGTLPAVEEGSLVLVAAQDGGALLRLPDAAAGAHRVELVVDGVIHPDGAFVATVRETSRGASASAERGATANLPPADYQQRLERWASREIPAARVSEATHSDANDVFELSMRVAAAGYAQLMQERLLVFKPPFSLTRRLPALAGRTRTEPVLLESIQSSGTLRVDVPTGFALDELPQAATIESPFGRYTLAARQDGGRVIVERTLALARATVPVADYAALRAFVDKVRAADTSPVVFCRR